MWLLVSKASSPASVSNSTQWENASTIAIPSPSSDNWWLMRLIGPTSAMPLRSSMTALEIASRSAIILVARDCYPALCTDARAATASVRAVSERAAWTTTRGGRLKRRTLLQTAGAMALAVPFAGVWRRAHAVSDTALRPVPDGTTGLPLLKLPDGFSYRSFGWTGDPMLGGAPTPDRHDGMAAFPGSSPG